MFGSCLHVAVSRCAIPLTVALWTLGSVVPSAAVRQERVGACGWRNPLVSATARAARATQVGAPIVSASSQAELTQVVAEYAARRTPELTIELSYDFSFSQVEGIVDEALERVLGADDYLRYTFSGYGAGWSGFDGNVTIGLSLSYLTSAEQETFVDARVEALGAQLFSPEMNGEQLELAAHDWLVTHMEYDAAGSTGELRYTAYGALSQGLAVCQGYALVLYRLCRAAGLEVRIVPGLGNGEDHAWNLVRVCGSWYHVDATWDDPLTDPPDPGRVRYGYFNRSDTQLRVDHTWEADGLPAAVTDYISGVCVGATQPLSWTLDRDAAVSTAQAEGKRILAVAGHPEGPGTTEMLGTVFQWYWPRVRPLLQANFVVWLCDVDASEEWQPLAAGLGAFDLPLLCVVDPDAPETALARLSGTYSPADFLTWLRPWAPSVATAVSSGSWGWVKQRAGSGR